MSSLSDAEDDSEELEEEWEDVLMHKGTLYLKAKEGQVYDTKTKNHVGKVDESGNVEMKTSELEEELYSGEG